MERIGEKIFSVAILAFFTFLISMSFQLSPVARRMPLFIGIIGLVATLALVIREFRKAGNGSTATSAVGKKEQGGVGIAKTFRQRVTENNEVGSFAWLVIFFLIIYFMGSLAGIPVFLFLVTRYFFKERWHVSLLLAAGSLTVYYLFFLKLLRMASYEGLLWTLFRF